MPTAKETARSDALSGVRVLDFTMVMAGPYATRMLADLGADVLKVEPLSGDQVRARPPVRNEASAYFAHLNAGKRSIALNLKDPEAIAIVKALVPRFDIVVENFRPGVMHRFGLDYATLAAINPKLIYCSISGFGQHGPRSQDPAYAPVVHASSGYDLTNLSYQDGALDRPANSGIFIADVLGGTHAFGAIQAALYQREKIGEGQFIDLSMLEAMLGMLVFEVQQAQFGGPRRPIYTPLKTSDGFIMVAPTSPRNFDQLAEAIGHAQWRDDPRFRTNADRNRNWSELMSEIETWTICHSAAEAEAILTQGGVPCARYRTLQEVMTDPQIVARSALATVHDKGGALQVTNAPFRMSRSNTQARDHVSELGEDGPTVLAEELQMSEAEIVELLKKGVLGLGGNDGKA